MVIVLCGFSLQIDGRHYVCTKFPNHTDRHSLVEPDDYKRDRLTQVLNEISSIRCYSCPASSLAHAAISLPRQLSVDDPGTLLG